MTSPTTLPLDPSPSDAVSRVSFSPTSASVLVSTWAGTLSIHSSTTGLLHHEAPVYQHPLLDAAWAPIQSDSIVAAGLDGSVLLTSYTETGLSSWQTIGNHQRPVRCVAAVEHVVVSGGWDCMVRFWDVRAVDKNVADVHAGGKVYALCPCGVNAVAFATSERRVRVVDKRKTAEFVYDKAPPTLQYQLRGLSASADGAQYVVGSTEGRVAVEWLNGKAESFSFKCHRADGLAFPVNTVAHNDKYGSFATGGGDGHVSFWDGDAKKRIAQYPRYQTSVSSLGFDRQSERIVVAVSYTFEEGEKDHPPDEVHIRKVDDEQIATKSALQRKGEENDDADGKPLSAPEASKP